MPQKKSKTSRHSRIEKIDKAKIQEFRIAFEESIRPGIAKIQRRKAEALVASKNIVVTNAPIDPETGEDLL